MGWNLRGLLAVGLGHAINDFFSGTIALTIFFVAREAGLPPWYQGALGFLWYVTSSVVQPLFGAYTDRHGRWWFLPTGVLLVVVAISCASLASSAWMLALLIVVGGLGSAVMHPEAGKYAALLSGERRSSGISIFQVGGNLGYALGPVAIAALLAHFGRFGSAFMLVPGLLAAAFLFVAIHGAHSAAEPSRKSHAQSSAAHVPVDRIGIGLVITSTAIRTLTLLGLVTYLPNVFTARGGSLVVAGQIVTAMLIMSIPGTYFGGWLGDRLGAINASILAIAGSIPFFLGFFYLPSGLTVPSLLLGALILALQNSPTVVIAQALLPRSLGLALGLVNGVAFGAGALLVTGIGVAMTHFGPENALVYVGVLPLVLAAASFALLARRTTQQRVLATAP